MAPVKHRIFVSHSHLDNDFGTKLAQDLRRVLDDEDAVFYDVLGGLHGGDSWWEKIVEELTARDVFLLVLSPDAMNSRWVRREMNMAINENKNVIPLHYRTCTMRADLKTIHIISFLAPKPYEAAFQEVLGALGLPKAAVASPSQKKTPTTDQQPSPPPLKTKEQWLNEGKALFDLKRYEEALAAYDQAIRLDPDDANAYYWKGFALQALKKSTEARQAFEKARQLGFSG